MQSTVIIIKERADLPTPFIKNLANLQQKYQYVQLDYLKHH